MHNKLLYTCHIAETPGVLSRFAFTVPTSQGFIRFGFDLLDFVNIYRAMQFNDELVLTMAVTLCWEHGDFKGS